ALPIYPPHPAGLFPTRRLHSIVRARSPYPSFLLSNIPVSGPVSGFLGIQSGWSHSYPPYLNPIDRPGLDPVDWQTMQPTPDMLFGTVRSCSLPAPSSTG